MLFGKRPGLSAAGSAIGALCVAIGALFIPLTAARGAIVTAGTSVTPTGLLGGLPGGLPAGDALIANETEPFTGTNAQSQVVFTGTVTSLVFADPSEPDTGMPGEDFVYQLTDNSGSTDSIDQLALSSFAGFLTDANYLVGTGNYVNTGPGDLAPASASSSVAPAGKTISFGFPVSSTTVMPGDTTDYVVIETNATSQPVQGTAAVIDGGSGSTGTEAPVATVIFTVPEPATFGVLAVVGSMILGRRRR